jgi:membrane-bound lytic murein transglycosylase D
LQLLSLKSFTAECEGRVEKDSKGIMRHLSGRGGAVKLGLAASSLALVAGRTVMPSQDGAASDSPVSPASENSAVKQVSWDLPLPATDNDRIDFFTEFLMGKNHDKTQQWLERIGKYGPMIQNELKERGMPQDLLYLAMIESGLSPHATSSVKAAGMWQFMQETGERYGLDVNKYVDERRDPIESTGAALTYLQEMHDRFGSWFLSAAGYNTGENRVGRLVKERIGVEKADTEDMYWQIWDKLPSETRDYVPLMLAMGKIAKEPAKYGFKSVTPQAPLQYEEVSIAGGTKLSDVAMMAGVNATEVNELNPHLIRKMTPPGGTYKVRVPVGKSQTVLAALGGSGASGLSSESGSSGSATAAP